MPPKPSDTVSCDQIKSWQWNIFFEVTTFLCRCLQAVAKAFATAFSQGLRLSVAEDREHPVHTCSSQSPDCTYARSSAAMRERGATAVYAGMVEDELERSICSGDFQLVFLSPESMITDGRWRDVLLSSVYQERLVGLVDEGYEPVHTPSE